jgi:hypothetical protein
MTDEERPNPGEVDLGPALGAESVSPQCFSIYVPNKDRRGVEIGNQRRWVLDAIRQFDPT